jgi:hypothetical protein
MRLLGAVMRGVIEAREFGIAQAAVSIALALSTFLE